MNPILCLCWETSQYQSLLKKSLENPQNAPSAVSTLGLLYIVPFEMELLLQYLKIVLSENLKYFEKHIESV